MGDNDDDETLVLRSMAHRMSQGIETKTRKHGLLSFDNIFIGTVSVMVQIFVVIFKSNCGASAEPLLLTYFWTVPSRFNCT